MSKAVVALTGSTIALAVTTIYFAYELGALRNAALEDKPSADAPAATVNFDSPRPAEESIEVPRLSRTAATPATAPAPYRGNDPKARRAEQLARYGDVAREFMAKYKDPESRGDLLKEEWNARRDQLSALRGRVDLTEEQWEAVTGLQAAERLDYRARSTRCFLDEKCERPEPAPRALEDRREALIAQIGRKKVEAVQSQEKRGAETAIVTKLQERLPPELRLRPVEMDALMDAMSEESASTLRDLQSRGIEAGVFSSWSLVAHPLDAATLEERMDVAREATDRMRTRAATLLRGEQFETFDVMLDDGLVMFRSFARREISLRNLRPSGETP